MGSVCDFYFDPLEIIGKKWVIHFRTSKMFNFRLYVEVCIASKIINWWNIEIHSVTRIKTKQVDDTYTLDLQRIIPDIQYVELDTNVG